ncbi:MAG TPA: phospholipase [Cyanothece sp. UBA12306]|nr:phospholipase [Cyanothece sp. UBA12306]
MINRFLVRGLVSFLGIGLIAYFGLCLALIRWQNKLIFFPSQKINANPKDLWLNYEDVWLNVLTLDGKKESIHGWWIPANSSKKDNKKVILYLHGNGGNISHNLAPAQRFQNLGFSVFMIDYRGYGQSKGEFPTEAEVYRDSQIAWNYLAEEREIRPQNIIIYGHSLGGAIAIDLAVRKPQAGGIIAENTFTSIRQMIDYKSQFYQLFPIDLILHQRFDSLSKLRLLQIPLLLIHGTSDRTVPSFMSQRLFKLANVPKKLLLVPYADHNNVASVSGEKYLDTIKQFNQLTDDLLAKVKSQGIVDYRF